MVCWWVVVPLLTRWSFPHLRARFGGLRCSPVRLEQVLADQVGRGQFDGVLAVEAGHAEPGSGLLGGPHQTLLGDVAERVGADLRADAVHIEATGDQLGAGGEVDAVEAGPFHRRGRDADVDLDGPGLAQHPDQRPLRVAAHDRVIDDDQSLALDLVDQGIELEADAELPQRLRGLDEGAADIGVLGEALPVGDAGGLGVADSGRDARLGDADDQVGVDRVLLGESAADLDASGVDAAPGQFRVGTGQVDVFEQAALRLGRGEAGRAQPVLVDGDHLAGLDLADEVRADGVERGRLTGHGPAAGEPPEHERVDALRVTRGVQGVLVHEHQAERAAKLRQDPLCGGGHRLVGPGRQQRGDQVRVGGGAVHVDAEAVDLFEQVGGVDQVPVVGQGDRHAGFGRADGRLGVLPVGGSGGGVAGVADGQVPLQRGERGFVENLGDQAEILVDDGPGAV
ncbi:hypothetical protein GCM10029992_11220 [Glycomyces albus]